MGFLDELKHKAGELGDKAKGGFGAAKDKADDLVDDVKERMGSDDPVANVAGGTESADEPLDPAARSASGSAGQASDATKLEYDRVLDNVAQRADRARTDPDPS